MKALLQLHMFIVGVAGRCVMSGGAFRATMVRNASLVGQQEICLKALAGMVAFLRVILGKLGPRECVRNE